MNDTINDKRSTEDGGAVGKPAVIGWVATSADLPQPGIEVIGIEANGKMVICAWWPHSNWSSERFMKYIKYWHTLPEPPCP